MQPEINWTFSDIQSWNPDVFMDLHTHSTTEDCFFYKGGSHASTIALMDNVSNYWPETNTSRYTTTKSAGQVYSRLGIYSSVLMEHPQDNRTSTVKHPADHNPQNIDDWRDWGVGIGLGLYDYFNLGDLLVDSDFNASVNSSDLRYNSTSQDWYESRNDDPTLLTLNVSDVGGNSGKKASLKGYSTADTAYLTQEFKSQQNGGLNISFDVYVDKINSYFNPVEDQYYNRTGFIYIGDDSGGTSGPCSTSTERFAYLTFFDSTPGDSGNDLEIRARESSSQSWHRTHEWSQVASGLSYDTWYTLRLEVDVSTGIYNVYVDDVLYGDGVFGYLGYASGSLAHISFSVGGTARGEFYVDNVSASKMLFNYAPVISDEFPVNGSSDVSISTSLLSVNITDVDGNLFNYTIETSPDIGGQDNSSGPGEVGGIKTCSVSGLNYDTCYYWFVNVSDGNSWNNVSFWFDTEHEPSATQLVDSEFSVSVNSSDLRANSSGQDWYESCNQNQSLLTLNISNVGGNTGKKAGIRGDDLSDYVYLTQEYSSAQSGLFNVSFDVFVDRISDRDAYDRTCHVYMGDDSGGTSGPCSTGVERFLLLTFFDSTPGDIGDDLELRARESVSQSWSNTSTWTQVTSGLSYDTWYTFRLEVNVSGGTYDVFVDDVLVGDDVGGYDEYFSVSVKHISFYGGGAARGDFFLDNVFSAAAIDRYTLDVAVVGNGSVVIDPGESTYGNGTIVGLTAVADNGWIFSHWMGDISGSDNPENVIMDDDKSVVAVFSSMLLVDSGFNFSVDSDELRANSTGQDWYESRNYSQDLLTLDSSVVGSDSGKKAAVKGYDLSSYVYLTQEYSSAQSGLFNVSFDVFVDRISDRDAYDRTCHVYMGDDSGGTSGPCSTGVERFLLLTFFDSTPGDIGDDLELRARESVSQSWSNTSTWTQVTSGLSYDTWYTFRLEVNVSGGTYDVFVDDVLVGDDVGGYDEYFSVSVKHISFYGGGAARGDFFLDNVFAPATNYRHKLDINVVGGGSIVADPGESTYANGTVVELEAVADPGSRFSHWSGDIISSNVSEYLLMDDDKSVVAHFEIGVLVDSEFNDSVNSSDLRANSSGQDWFESRNNYPGLLILDMFDIGNNKGKKAGIEGRDTTNFAYLTQEFSSPQLDTFNVSLDIYIDVISSYFDPYLNRTYNRTGLIFIGDDSSGTYGPCSTSVERFVFLAFYDSTPGDIGDDLELRARESVAQSWYRTYDWTPIASNLSYDTWYTLTLEVNVTGRTYDVYVNDVLMKANISGYASYASDSVRHISFYGGGTGRGNFFVDNVFTPAADRYTLDVDVVGNGSVDITPGEATYTNGTVVMLNATNDLGWSFDHWGGDLSGSTNPASIGMTHDMTIIANFSQDEYTLIVDTDGNGSVNVEPDQSTYLYGNVVELNASGDSGWVFTHWSGDLVGSTNPISVTMTGNRSVTAHFSQDVIYTLTVNIVGEGYVSVDPDWALYLDGAVVELNASGDPGWSFAYWSDDLSGSINPANITMTDNMTVTATFNSSLPEVETMNATDITDTTAYLWGNLTSDGGENCSVWFEWGSVVGDFEECMGTIATGSVCKDGRSIVHKNRHRYVVNQKPYFYQGTNYSYFGVGTEQGMCRMGQNEKGLAMVNMDVGGTITNWEYQSDGQASNASYDDSDFHIPLGNYSTVYDAAMYLALHGTYGVGGNSGQYLIISSEPGVGAVVAIDSVLHTNITWINNTYAACTVNKWYCDGQTGGYATRAKQIMDDIVNGNNSSDGDNLLNWKDIVQRVAKDTSDKEQGEGTFYIGGEISQGACRAASVHVAGNSSLNSSIHMSWLCFGETPQIGIFLPIYAGNLHSTDDIPSNFTDDNGGDGIHPYVNVKRDYASEGLPSNYYYCDRVREIQEYAFFNENITFYKFDDIMETTMCSEDDVRSILAEYVNNSVPIALSNYINNLTFYSTNKLYPQRSGLFNETIMNLDPGSVYYCKTWANNSLGMSNGSRVLFMTEPDIPTNVEVFTYNDSQINLTWYKGSGAHYTIIERNVSGVNSWNRGEGVEIYNDTGIRYEDAGLVADARYCYQLWSFASDYGEHQYSSNYVSVFSGGPEALLSDSMFNDSVDSADLRFDAVGQDWYESRNDDQTLLTLDINNISGNSGKKAGLKNYNISSNVYLSQEFKYEQFDVFNVSLDVFVDKIADDADYDRTGFIFIGDDHLGTNGPCSTSDERFVFLTFYDSTPGDSGDDLEIRARENSSSQPWAITSSWTQVASGLSYDTWYKISVELDVVGGKYDVFVDDVLKCENISKYDGYSSSSVKHISFSVSDRAKGEVFVDNVFSPALPSNKPPLVSGEYPLNGSTFVDVSFSQLSVSITDRESDLFNYTIETSPDVGNCSGFNEFNGTKTCNISSLSYNTFYTWFVNTSDCGSGLWANRSFMFTTEPLPGTWWDNGWLFRKRIAINHSLVTANLTNFPVLIETTDTHLANNAQANGDDIVFTDYYGKQLSHEIEFYNGISGELICWVNVTNLRSMEETILYIYYGNPICGSQEYPEGVWDSHFVMVQHLDETGGTHYDSTTNGNDGTPYGGLNQDATGIIDGADEFDGSNDYISISNSISGDDTHTISFWVKPTQWSKVWLDIGADSGYSFIQIDSNMLHVGYSPASPSYRSYPYTFTLGNWYHITSVKKGSGDSLDVYVNGVLLTSYTGSVGNMNGGSLIYLGNFHTGSYEAKGVLDEVWFCDTTISAAWVETCYHNQYSPSTFYSIGGEETTGETRPYLSIPSPVRLAYRRVFSTKFETS